MADLTRKTANLSSLNEVNDTITNSYFKNNKLTIIPVTAGTYTISFYLAEKTSGILNGSIGIGTLTDYAYDIDNYPTPDNIPYTITRTFTITQSQIDTYGGYIWARFLRYNSRTDFSYKVTQIMLNTGSTALPYEPYGWVHSLRKLGTETETIQSGDTIYANGQPITTYDIKGNTVQNGTPTPSNPVSVNGVGERTENLFDFNMWFAQLNPTRCTVSKNGYSITVTATGTDGYTGNSGFQIPVESSTTYTFYYESDVNINGAGYIFENGVADADHWHTFNNNNRQPVIFTTRADTTYIILRLGVGTSDNSITYSDLMLNTGSTALPYEPYGVKIPISSGQTVNNYLGSIQSTRQIKKWVFDGSESWSLYESGNNRFFCMNIADRITQEPSLPCTHGFTVMSIAGSGNYIIRIYDRSSLYPTKDDFTDFLADQYAAGTPVTVWYVLVTPTTSIVNEPLMKIGTYADSISNAAAIPTTEGANSITVDTTVQPSEFTATWTGWHDAYVKEKSENDWNNEGFSAQGITDTHTHSISNNYGTTLSTTTGNEVTITQSDYPTGNTGYQNGYFYIDIDLNKYTVGDTLTISFDYVVNEAHSLVNNTTIYVGNKYSLAPSLSSNSWNMSGKLTATFNIVADMRPYIEVRLCGNSITVKNVMLNSGSTALPYEPYWK